MVPGASSNETPLVEIRLLGSPAIALEGRPADVDTRKAVALLALLVVEDAPMSRDRLCAMLWPESSHQKARGALRRTLTSLRRAIGSEAVSADRESVVVELPGSAIDERSFTALTAAGDIASLRSAVDLYRGDFLAGFHLRDAPEFDDWHRSESERLRRTADRALELLADHEMASSKPAEAVRHSRSRLALDQLNEPAHQQVLLAEAQAGRRDRAIEHYRHMVRLFEEELGVAPLVETTSLYERIRRGDLTPVRETEPVEAAPPRTLGVPEMVGRDDEIREILAAYGRSARSGRVVIIDGGPGVGLSALATEVHRQVMTGGGPCASVRCHEGEEGLPYAVLSHLLATLIGDRPEPGLSGIALDAVAQVAPGLGLSSSAAFPQGPEGRIRLFEGLRMAVDALSGDDAPMMLVVDDVEFIDDASAHFLAYLARRLAEMAVTLVLTVRPSHRPAVVDLLAAAANSGVSTRLSISPLGDADTARLVRVAGGEGLGEADVAEIVSRSAGIPQLAVEYARALSASGVLPDVPDPIRAVIGSRLARLGEVARQLVDAAAVIGSTFSVEAVRAVSGRADEEVESALDELEGRGLIERTSGPAEFEFVRGTTRAVVLDEAGPGRILLLHRRASAHLSGKPRPTAADLKGAATHAEASGDGPAAARLYALGGSAAARVHANDEAAVCYAAALALGHPDVAHIREAIGDLAALRADYRAAVGEYEAAAAFLDGPDLVRVEHKIGEMYARRGDRETAATYFSAALTQAENGDRIRVLADLAVNDHRLGNRASARSRAAEALEMADRSQDAGDLAVAANVAGLLDRADGRPDEAAVVLERGRLAAARSGDPARHAAIVNNLALVALDRARPIDAIALFDQALAEARRIGDRHREAAIWSNLGDARYAAGLADEAAEAVKTSARIMAEIGREGETFIPEVWKLTDW